VKTADMKAFYDLFHQKIADFF